MNTKIGFLIVSMTLFVSSCKKDTEKVSPQTILLLQNKWTLISSSMVFPTNTSLNSAYRGISTDYYQFGSNDSLTIRQAGQASLPTIPLSIATKYFFIDNATLAYNLNPNIQINIKVLTNDLLVLTNSATSTFTSSGGVVTIYEGTKTDSLRR
jgi:hypothetical protein